jgi:hypothetical protein
MFAHDELTLPDNLLPDDVADLLARLGHRVDRRNVTRALEGAGIPGVAAPASRARRWTIPRGALLDVVAAVLHRRWCRAAAPGRWSFGSPARHRLPAARLLLREPALAPLVPEALRREVRAERRRADAEALERRRRELREEQRRRRTEEGWRRRQEQQIERQCLFELYAATWTRAREARVPAHAGGRDDAPEYRAFVERWPRPSAGPPGWWRPPPRVLPAAVERFRPYWVGKAARPEIQDLLPRDVAYGKPWPWRAEGAAG